ncbi:MAG: hypothetical protein PHE49_02825 [bacterium]|nr:hypothetical protein [bacterium]
MVGILCLLVLNSTICSDTPSPSTKILNPFSGSKCNSSFQLENSKQVNATTDFVKSGDTCDTIITQVFINPFSGLEKEYYHRRFKKSDSLIINALSLKDSTLNKTTGLLDSELINQNLPYNTQTSVSEITSDKKSGSKFFLNGSKTLGVSIDSRKNVEFDQSTQLSLNGNMGSEVNIEGVLNDDNLPIQPEGSTQELKQLDEMYIKINKGNSKLKFGDINFNTQTHFGTLDRELEGITGELISDTRTKNKSNILLLGGAISKGKWVKKEFQGKFGKQGPYELSSQYTVTAGSEKVALNGNYLKRGKEYTIDYSDGSLTFTNIVPIKDEDKIIISFQEKEEEYKNSVYMANGKLNKSGTLQAMLFKEKDIIDAHQPTNFQNISYDSLYGWVSGATFKGTNKGSYTKKDSIYEYAGYNKGDYEIGFTMVNKGDYKFDPFIGGYKYVGKDSGDYIPMIKTSLPQDKLVMDIDYSCQAKGVDFTLAGGATQFSPNTLGQSNANQKTGKAFLAKIETKKSLWGAGVSARTIDSTFYFPGTTDTLDRVYGEVFGSVAPITPLRCGIDGKITKTATDIKPQLGITLSPHKLPSLYYKYNGGKTNNTNEFLLSYKIKSIEPFCKYKIIKSQTDTFGYKTSNELKGIGIQNSIFNIGTEENKSFNTKTISNNISITKNPIDLAYIYTQKFYSGNKYVVDLGNLRVTTKNINVGYNLSSSEEQLFQEEYYEVAPGKGSFSKDSLSGTYYQNYHGNYEKKLVPSGNSSIHKNFQFANSFTFSPNTNIIMRIGNIKRGEGNKVLFWERATDAFDDRNQTNCGIQAGIVTLTYTKEDYRENKLYNTPTCGEQGIWLTEAKYKKLTFNYTNKTIQNYRNNIRIWKEDANTAGIGKNIFNKPILYLSIQSETRNVSLSEESPQYKFYGYNVEPSFTYEIIRNSLAGNNNNFEVPATLGCRFKVTHWLGNNQIPLTINAIYPSGITLDWDANITIIGKMNTNYILSYQGNKTPTYPTDHKLNAQVQLNF